MSVMESLFAQLGFGRVSLTTIDRAIFQGWRVHESALALAGIMALWLLEIEPPVLSVSEEVLRPCGL